MAGSVVFGRRMELYLFHLIMDHTNYIPNCTELVPRMDLLLETSFCNQWHENVQIVTRLVTSGDMAWQ